jgi:hypothetical protein
VAESSGNALSEARIRRPRRVGTLLVAGGAVLIAAAALALEFGTFPLQNSSGCDSTVSPSACVPLDVVVWPPLLLVWFICALVPLLAIYTYLAAWPAVTVSVFLALGSAQQAIIYLTGTGLGTQPEVGALYGLLVAAAGLNVIGSLLVRHRRATVLLPEARPVRLTRSPPESDETQRPD